MTSRTARSPRRQNTRGPEVPDTLPSRHTKTAISRKSSAHYKRRYDIGLYELDDGSWTSVVRAKGPGIRDTGIGMCSDTNLKTVIASMRKKVLADHAAARG